MPTTRGPSHAAIPVYNEAYKSHPSLNPISYRYRLRPVGHHNLVHRWKTFRERRRMLMTEALSNPTWRRRSWLVVLRARRTRYLRTREGRLLKWFVFRRKGARGRSALPLTVDENNMAINSWPSGADGSFQQVVMKVIDLPEGELFRSIVSYI